MAQNTATLRLSHLSLGVNNLDVSEAFYRDVLCLETRRQGDDVVVRWANFLLILSQRPPTTRAKFHIGFRVDSPQEVDAWAERIRNAGVNIMSGPFGTDNARQLFFIDPDDYELEIYSE